MVGAVAEDGDAPTGPLCAAGPRTGKAKKQYCWWITMSFPYPEMVARLGLKTPDDFTPDTFLEMVRAAHVARGIQLDEAVVFTEKHQCTNAGGERLKHLNALVRTKNWQYRWRPIALVLMETHHVRVDFATHIRSWHDGMMYGAVASDHKPQEQLDPAPFLWAAHGAPRLPLKSAPSGPLPSVSGSVPVGDATLVEAGTRRTRAMRVVAVERVVRAEGVVKESRVWREWRERSRFCLRLLG